MKIIIKSVFLSLIVFGIIGFKPIISYAYYEGSILNGQYSIDNLRYTIKGSRYNRSGSYLQTSLNVGSGSGFYNDKGNLDEYPALYSFLYVNGNNYDLVFYTGKLNPDISTLYYIDNYSELYSSGNEYSYHIGYNLSNNKFKSHTVGASGSGGGDRNIYYYSISNYLGINNATFIDGFPIIEYDESKNITNIQSAITYAYNNPNFANESSNNLGVLKNVTYKMNYVVGSKGKYESITWGRYSTTGHDLDDGNTLVEFALQDKSTINNKTAYMFGERSDNSDGTVSLKTNEEILREIQSGTQNDVYNSWNGNAVPFISRITQFFAEHVYPYGSTNRAISKGLINTAPSYNKMISLGTVNGMNHSYSFNGLYAYTTSSNFALEAPEIHSSLSGVYNTNLPNFLKGGFIESVVSNSNYYNIADYNLSYNIYARIVKGNDKGAWLLIDKHGNSINTADPLPNGGITKRPVILPDYEPTNDFTDAPEPQDIPYVDDNEDGEDDNDDDEPLIVETTIDDLENPSDGGNSTTYNNYTYNYDNRSWVENHYNNEDISEVNEGLEWIKLFPAFFGLFLTMFGAFLPGWAVVVVTIAIPIICGLLVFKIIKGVIPFV